MNCGTFLPRSEFESQKNHLVGQNSSALPKPLSLNPKDPEGKIDCEGKIHLAANRKASYIKMSTIHFQTISAPLKFPQTLLQQLLLTSPCLVTQAGVQAGRIPSKFAFNHLLCYQNGSSRPSQAKERKLARWWDKTPPRCSSEINALMTAVLFGTAAILSTGQRKSEPF